MSPAPGSALRAALSRGRKAWPRLELDEGLFFAHVARFAEDEARVAELYAEDLYLACGCALGERHALAAFDERYLSKVPAWIARLRRGPELGDEVAQALRERLLVRTPDGRLRIEEYDGRGPLEPWLRTAAVRLALNLVSSNRRHEPGPEAPDDAELGATADPELAYLRQRYLPQFRAAFAGAMAALAGEERSLLRFYLVDRLDIGAIGVIFGKSRATVGRMMVDCRRKILAETRKALEQALGASTSEVKSLVRLLESQLDVSLQAHLEKNDGAA